MFAILRSKHFKRTWSAHLRLLEFAALVGAILAIFCPSPATPGGQWLPVASAHALPIRSDPASHAILHSPPSQVTIWFDDALIVTTSHMMVENASGQEVDRRESRVNCYFELYIALFFVNYLASYGKKDRTTGVTRLPGGKDLLLVHHP